MTKITPKRRGGVYWVEGKPYPSVTEVLKVIDKPAIRHWYGQQVYYAMCKNPGLSEQEALVAPYQTSKDAASRGSTVHSIIEAYRTTGTVVAPTPQFEGYAKAFQEWVREHNPQILESEKTVVNTEYSYAGTLDMLAVIGGKKYVVDFKTSKDGSVYTEAHLQVSAYQHCLEGVDGGVIVGLAPDGSYNHQIAKNGFRAFVSALDLYIFINYAKLKALGWERKE